MTAAVDKLKEALAHKLMMGGMAVERSLEIVNLIERIVDQRIAELREALRRVGDL